MKKKWILIVSILILLIVMLVIFYIRNSMEPNDQINKKDQTFESIQVDMKEAQETLSKGEKSEVILKVNNQDITQLDVNYQKFINDNLNTNKTKSDEEIIDECIKNEVILQEAKKQGISIDEEEKEIIKEYYSDTYNQEDEKIAKGLGMAKEEYIQTSINKIIDNRNIAEFHNKIYMKILKNELNIDDENFKEYIKQANSEKDDKKRIDLYEKAYEAYVEYLVKNSEVMK